MKNTRGFTMIELLVTIAIAGILLAVAVPNMSNFIANSSVATAAQSIQNGVRQAQNEARKRNIATEFAVTNASIGTTPAGNGVGSVPSAAGGRNWVARTTEVAPQWAIGQNQSEAYPNVTITETGTVAAASIFFNGRGQVATNSDFAPANLLSDYQVFRVARTDGRQRVLCVYVSPGGGVNMCDPSKAATDPRGCNNIPSTACPANPS